MTSQTEPDATFRPATGRWLERRGPGTVRLVPYGIVALALVGALPLVVVLAAIGANIYWVSLVLKLRDLLGGRDAETAAA